MTTELITMQKEMNAHLKKRVADLFGTESEELRKYRLAHEALGQLTPIKCLGSRLTKRIKSSRLIFIGDFHTFDQNSKNLERVFLNFQKGHKSAIGVEFVHSENQQYIDDYLDSKINEVEFLNSIHYTDSWRFPWGHYREIFKWAKKYKLRVLALNSNGTLPERDQHASDIIASYLKEHELAHMLVFFGEYHIVNDKLPRLVTDQIPNLKYVIIHQNIDDLYWKLTKTMVHDNIYRFNDAEYLIITSPPWIKYESILYWYENLSEDPEFEIHQFEVENNKKLGDDVEETFLTLSSRINKILKLKIDKDLIEDFNLIDYTGLDRVYELIGNNVFLRKLIRGGKSFKVPNCNYYYCPNYSVNRLSFLIGVHLLGFLTPGLYEKRVRMSSSQERFIYFFYQSLFSYYCSKCLNPFRKCDYIKDVKTRLTQRQTGSKKKENLRVALKIINHPKHIKEELGRISLRGIHSVAKTLGNMVGDWLYFHRLDLKDYAITERIYDCEFPKEILTIFKDPEFRKCRKRKF